VSRPVMDTEWRRTWSDGLSRVTVEREDDGRVLIGVTDISSDGYAASFDRATADQIAAFIRGEQ
jgi:hypothetical protein